MGIYTKLPEDLKEVDIVIAGGGSAGCIVAGRLAAADPGLSILLIEWGRNNYNDPKVVNPIFFLHHLVPANKTAHFYQANRSSQLADREPVVPAGGTLGGGSSINFMMYTRAQRADFDSWNTPGWSADEILPYLKKIETYHGPGNPSVHGYDGPVQVSDGGFCCKRSTEGLLQAARALGYPEITDLQDLDSSNGWERWLRTVSPEGKRQDTAHTYIHPLLQDGKHPNLHVLVEHKVIRVLFDPNKRARGVEFCRNPEFIPVTPLAATTEPSTETIAVRKLVVISSGSCASPAVLERSGIGSPEVLNRAGIPVISDLPGVGHDYQDHNLNESSYRTSLEPDETADDIFNGRVSPEDAVANKHPMLGWNTIDVAAKYRPTDEEAAQLGPEFAEAWERDFRDKPNRPMMLTGLRSGLLSTNSSVPEGQYAAMVNYTAYPYSRGRIHITSASPFAPLDFSVGFFTDNHDIDIKKLLWAYKKAREIIRRTEFYRGEVASTHPKFPSGSAAACIELPLSTSHDTSSVKDIVYTEKDDKAIEQFLRENTHTTWHSLGTNKMAPRQEMGVVDKDLNVYGVSGLKVVDLSIAPQNVGGNTNNTAMVIGEKGAEIIARELGLQFSMEGRLVSN
ncbi:GMC oxidoreductase [Apodospora peruviana]|uniref:GMC oxidoreductase n=1 Tax=Apodospora peruviana TaxID=516989 RepID=A0AAE0MBV8_9PEZI|nr:GMC oxidoreductase [Apodospora peruviana]